MSIFCTNCGTELPDGSSFCTECGTKVVNTVTVEQTAAPVIEQPAAPAVDAPVELVLNETPVYEEPAPTAPVAEQPAAPVAEEPATPVADFRPRPITDTEAVFGAAPAAPVAPVIAPTPNPQPEVKQVVLPEPEIDSKALKVVSTAAFFWLNVLYCIPGIGLIACIIIAAAARNLNIKHHACAMLIMVLVGLVCSIIGCILCAIAIRQAGLTFEDILKSVNAFY